MIDFSSDFLDLLKNCLVSKYYYIDTTCLLGAFLPLNSMKVIIAALRKIMEPQKPDNSLRVGPEIVERQRAAKEQPTQRVRSWTVHSEMTGVLGRMFAGAA